MIIGVRLIGEPSTKLYWFKCTAPLSLSSFWAKIPDPYPHFLVDTTRGYKIGKVEATCQQDVTEDGLRPTRYAICYVSGYMLKAFNKEKNICEREKKLDNKIKSVLDKIGSDDNIDQCKKAKGILGFIDATGSKEYNEDISSIVNQLEEIQNLRES